jgi:hypothetical protein
MQSTAQSFCKRANKQQQASFKILESKLETIALTSCFDSKIGTDAKQVKNSSVYGQTRDVILHSTIQQETNPTHINARQL